jgi:hypothetical protein
MIFRDHCDRVRRTTERDELLDDRLGRQPIDLVDEGVDLHVLTPTGRRDDIRAEHPVDLAVRLLQQEPKLVGLSR